MKFINYLSSISGIGIYPLIGLMIFVPFFCLVIVWVMSASKEHLDEVSRLPIQDSKNTL